MRLGEFSVKNRASVFFGLIAIAIAGASAYSTLPRESFPDISIPNILVYTLWPGATPADVEKQLTDELERELQGLEGIKEITSTSTESVSVVNVEFASGTDLDFALQKVRDRVNVAKSEFPEEAEEPILRELNFSDVPILQVHLAGDAGPVELRRVAKELQDEVEAIPGVLRATLVGGVEREVKVDVDPERLRLYGASLDDVINIIRDENVSIPGGELKLTGQTLALRVPGEVEDPLEVEQFVVKVVDQRPIQIRDVADVSYGTKDRSSYSRIDGKESVSLSVQKRTGANIIAVTDRIKAEVERARERWPVGVTATLLADQSKDIRIMVADLENNILTGVVLVVFVLFFTMGLRNALFVGAAIPLAMLLTFIIVQLSGMTLNMMVLFSLVLAVGMLVDNSIVVVDNIYRHVQEGKTPVEAAMVGTREVGGAVLNSTLTTIAAFVPLFFWPGIVGDFMSILPIAVCMALAASLVIAFTANPTFAAEWMKLGLDRALVISDAGELPDHAGPGGWILSRYKGDAGVGARPPRAGRGRHAGALRGGRRAVRRLQPRRRVLPGDRAAADLGDGRDAARHPARADRHHRARARTAPERPAGRRRGGGRRGRRRRGRRVQRRPLGGRRSDRGPRHARPARHGGPRPELVRHARAGARAGARHSGRDDQRRPAVGGAAGGRRGLDRARRRGLRPARRDRRADPEGDRRRPRPGDARHRLRSRAPGGDRQGRPRAGGSARPLDRRHRLDGAHGDQRHRGLAVPRRRGRVGRHGPLPAGSAGEPRRSRTAGGGQRGRRPGSARHGGRRSRPAPRCRRSSTRTAAGW